MTTALKFNEEQYFSLAKLLLAAAYADGEFHALERDVIEDFLRDTIGDHKMNNRVIERLVEFDPKDCDVEQLVDGLLIETDEQHQEVLAIIAQIADADQKLDGGEETFIGDIVAALG
jgi:uncharacterized tellurite resistance protein B-like protein